jgi:hypothetical protein
MREEKATTVTALLASLPRAVAIADIAEVAMLDERIAAVGLLHANTIGVTADSLHFIPDNEPPLLEEQLLWLWTIQPQVGPAILTFPISADGKLLLNAYLQDEMRSFWDYLSQPESA